MIFLYCNNIKESIFVGIFLLKPKIKCGKGGVCQGKRLLGAAAAGWADPLFHAWSPL